MCADAQYRVRFAGESDSDILTDFRIRLFQEAGDGPDPLSLVDFRTTCVQAFHRGFQSQNCLAWLAEDDAGSCLGTLVMMLLPRLPSPKIPSPADEGYVL